MNDKPHNTPFRGPRASTGKATPPHVRRGWITYKLAVWDERLQCWRDGKVSHKTREDAANAALMPGRYRVSEIIGTGQRRRDGVEFTVRNDVPRWPDPANAVYPEPKE